MMCILVGNRKRWKGVFLLCLKYGLKYKGKEGKKKEKQVKCSLVPNAAAYFPNYLTCDAFLYTLRIK